MASNHSNASDALADLTNARNLAICVVGQGRTFEQAAPNILDATASLRRSGAEVLFVLDQSAWRTTERPSAMKRLFAFGAGLIPKSKLLSLIAVFSQTSPTATDLVSYSKGLEESLVRCRRLLKLREQVRGARFAYVMRLRPDMVFKYPLPPLHHWPRAQAPTLFTDYITCGLVGSNCGPSPTCPPSILRQHGLCADDNFGFMSRSVARVYFGHWDWHPQCAGTRSQQNASGVAARLDCVECKLGCTMFRRGIRVMEVANVSRKLVRSKEQRIPRALGRAAVLAIRTYSQSTGKRVIFSASDCP
eukprot:6180203-Pleurochrysis_carterae.AAC.1